MFVMCMFSICILLAIKKLKHKLVEKLDEKTADSLAISRAILIHGKLSVSPIKIVGILLHDCVRSGKVNFGVCSVGFGVLCLSYETCSHLLCKGGLYE